MTVKVAVARVGCNTTTGTQDITTTDLGGLTPKAALFILSTGITNASVVNHASLSIGATDGASQWATTVLMRHGQATSDTWSRAATTRVITQLSTSSGNLVADAAFSAFITNGVRINWTDASPQAYLLTVILFAGDDLSAKAGTVDALGPNGTETTVTTTFQPDDVFFAANGAAFGNTSTADAYPQIGFAHRGASIQEAAIAQRSADAATGAAAEGIASSDRISAIVSGGAISRAFELSAFLADGFKLKHHAGSSSASQQHGYLALSYGGKANGYVGAESSPTATGDATTTVGFQPQFVMIGHSQLTALGTVQNGAEVLGLGLSALTSTATFTTHVADENASNPTDSQSIATTQPITSPRADGTAGLIATTYTPTATGYTLGYTQIQTPARRLAVWAISEPITAHDLSATGIVTGAPLVGNASVGQNHGLTTSGISASAPVLGNPFVGQVHGLTATSATAGAPTLGAPTAGHVHALSATDINAQAPTLGAAAIGQNFILSAVGIAAAAPTLGTPAVGQAHGLSAAGVATDAPTLGSAAIGQAHVLSAVGIATGAPTLGSPVISTDGTDNLSAANLVTGAPVLGNPFVGQVHGLSAQGIVAGAPTLGAPSLGRIHNLNAVGITAGAATTGNPTLGSIGTDALAAQGIVTGAPTLGNPVFAQRHALLAVGIVTGAPVVGNALMGGRVLPPERTYVIPYEDRVYVVPFENRTYEV